MVPPLARLDLGGPLIGRGIAMCLSIIAMIRNVLKSKIKRWTKTSRSALCRVHECFRTAA